ncbi:formate--tetrahydrofolate ligase [bacterium]|nr:formate--tetrahydrofolate ligase [bacterium]
MKTDLDIQKEIKLRKITDVASELGLNEDDYDLYGKYKAKLNPSAFSKGKKNGDIILVTAITPTKAGEGKTTVSIGLAEGLRKINKSVCLALREPSLGPVMGLKGGATGGGYSQVLPMDEINFHFTGDFHALTSANNLISACIDNEIYFNSPLNIDPERVVWKRCLDVNDRTLRNITIGQGSKINGVERKDSFCITVASEIMAVFCLANDCEDLEKRLNNILVAYSKDGKEIFLKDLNITGAILLLLKEAFKPNLVQTCEGGPAIVHGGPFANIAHGCNSIMATKYARKLADFVVTEGGFGADLGCEKFLDIKSRVASLDPKCVVLVATIRALKMHGGVDVTNLKEENVEAMLKGIENLERHIETIKNFNKPFVVAINKFYTDTDKEIEALSAYLESKGYPYSLATIHTDGGNGGINLANTVLKVIDENKDMKLKYLYERGDSLITKIEKVSKKAYGATSVEISEKAQEKLDLYEKQGYSNLLICMAKTQNSVTDDAKVLGAPKDFAIHVKDVSLSLGAGFVVVYTGKIITMPGLPEDPVAKHMGISDDGFPYGIM